MHIRRRTTAKELQSLQGMDLMPRARRNQDGIAGADFTFLAIDFHQSATGQQIVKLLAEPMIVPLRSDSRWQGGFRKALQCDGRVGEIQQASDGRSVFGGKW